MRHETRARRPPGPVSWRVAPCIPRRDAVVDFARFETLATDERVRYEPGAAGPRRARCGAAAGRDRPGRSRPLPSVRRAGHRVRLRAASECFDQRVPGAGRFTAAVIHDNRVLLAPRLFEREPSSACTPSSSTSFRTCTWAAARPLHHAHSGLVSRRARLARRRQRRRGPRDRGRRAARDRGGRALPARCRATTKRAASTRITGSSGSRCSTARA